MDIITSSLIQSFSNTSVTDQPVGLAAPDVSATARFNAVMSPQPSEAAYGVAGVGMGEANNISVNPASATLGDKILNGVQNLSSEFQQSWKTVNKALDPSGSLSTTDLLKLQLGITQVSIQYDLVGKIISRSTQNIDQLVKLQ
jgi:type III secretion protein I